MAIQVKLGDCFIKLGKAQRLVAKLQAVEAKGQGSANFRLNQSMDQSTGNILPVDGYCVEGIFANSRK